MLDRVRRVESSSFWLRQCLALMLVSACRVYEPNKLESADDSSRTDGQFGADASVDPGAAGGMSSAQAGAGGGRGSSMCRPNLEGSFLLCPEICPEQCNGRDDDCDDKIDEEPASSGCKAPNSTSLCTEGQCYIDACLEGARDCDEDPQNGCEVRIDDPRNCGGCGRACSVERGEPMCSAGECKIRSCEAGYANCDEREDACETKTNTLNDCGGCGLACSDVANAAPSCETGSCGVGQCNAGWGDCDKRGDNGCEVPLGSLSDCGACGVKCDKASCAGGVCTAVNCGMTPGLADCDRDEVSCEVNLHTDPNNCGRCGFRCVWNEGVTPHGKLGCSEDGCATTCDPGWGDCDGDYRNGCEQSLNTNAHCGACRRGCNIPNAQESCSSGTCQVTQCDPNHADCNGDKTSCEVPITTPDNCGMCGRVCNLPHAIESCPSRSCEVASCEPNWGDCDGRDDNGCEQDTRALSEGGLGPCAPDADCVAVENDGRRYFICATARTWADARSRCRQQQRGDLAQIGNQAEADFLAARLPAAAWIGLNDEGHEGVWVWANNGVPIWQGAANGGAVDGEFTTWAEGEPNGSGNCAQLYTGGHYDDADCGIGRAFVCEINPDGCPGQPKNDPGQCGCDVADEDTDDDGFANCNDGCPNDPNKRAQGDCGCGNTEADRDGDGAADCIDECDDDPMKRASGACGCGTPETDNDGDGTPNCNDECPNDASTTEACFPYDPTNLDPGGLEFSNAPAAVLNCGTTRIDTTTEPPTLGNWCGAQPVVRVQNQANGPAVVVIALSRLELPADNTLRLVGTRPVAFAVLGDVTIAGTVDASAEGATPGAGGNFGCGGSAGGDGAGDSGTGGGGGGGGGYGTPGGSGGTGDNNGRGAAGGARGNGEIVPLVGGCAGGLGGGCGNVARAAGGGALQLSAAGTVNVSGMIYADGAPGANGCGSEGGAAGGGSGGAVLIEASNVNVPVERIILNGGRGGNADGGGGPGSTAGGVNGGNGANSGSNGGGGGGGGYGRQRVVMR